VIARDDHRGFQDRHADTDVVRVDQVAAPWSSPSTPE
jgi:hypothetical protein